MVRIAVTLALGLCLLGCDSVVPLWDRVDLLTGADNDICYAGGEPHPEGLLLVDPAYGTSHNGAPVMWPLGYTGRRAGSEVVVFDEEGKAVAITGRRYRLAMGWMMSNPEGERLLETIDAFPTSPCIAEVLADGRVVPYP
jgi:hypothetical protein